MPRRLGQHFLRPASVDRLLRAIDPRPDESFLEIGPGAGALTLPLAARAKDVVAVEIDRTLARRLAQTAPANVRVVEGDALDVDLGALLSSGGRIAGNLPYAISSPLLRRVLDLHARAKDAHLMLQDEVARRIAAAPGSKDYGILSVLFAVWAEVDIPLRFPPGAFSPPPRVDSAVIRVRFAAEPRVQVADPKGLERVVRQAFTRRRRTLENNLRDSYPNLKEHLKLLNIEGRRRAETLSVGEFARLADALGREPDTPERSPQG